MNETDVTEAALTNNLFYVTYKDGLRKIVAEEILHTWKNSEGFPCILIRAKLSYIVLHGQLKLATEDQHYEYNLIGDKNDLIKWVSTSLPFARIIFPKVGLTIKELEF